MFDRSCGFRICAAFLAAIVVLTSGCASPLAPPYSYWTQSGEVPRGGLSGVPHVVTDDQPIRFVGLTSQERSEFDKRRESFEEERERRIEQRKAAQLGARNTPGSMFVECVVLTLVIFSPVCIVIVPVALIAAHTVEGRRAARREPYMLSLPSDRELAQVEEKVREDLAAAAIAKRMLSDLEALGPAPHDGGFPRLVIRTESATFTTDRMMTISVLAEAQPAAGVVWLPTEHRYHIGYADEASVKRGLTEARTSIAASILWTYGLRANPPEGPQSAPSSIRLTPQQASGTGLAGFPAGVLEQEPKVENQGCAPFNARVGGRYGHENGRAVRVRRILGESSNCPLARPMAVELTYE